MPQAAPKIHLELGAYDVNGKAGWDKFVAVLENKDDYKDDKATKIKLTILKKAFQKALSFRAMATR